MIGLVFEMQLKKICLLRILNLLNSKMRQWTWSEKILETGSWFLCLYWVNASLVIKQWSRQKSLSAGTGVKQDTVSVFLLFYSRLQFYRFVTSDDTSVTHAQPFSCVLSNVGVPYGVWSKRCDLRLKLLPRLYFYHSHLKIICMFFEVLYEFWMRGKARQDSV